MVNNKACTPGTDITRHGEWSFYMLLHLTSSFVRDFWLHILGENGSRILFSLEVGLWFCVMVVAIFFNVLRRTPSFSVFWGVGKKLQLFTVLVWSHLGVGFSLWGVFSLLLQPLHSLSPLCLFFLLDKWHWLLFSMQWPNTWPEVAQERSGLSGLAVWGATVHHRGEGVAAKASHLNRPRSRDLSEKRLQATAS